MSILYFDYFINTNLGNKTVCQISGATSILIRDNYGPIIFASVLA